MLYFVSRYIKDNRKKLFNSIKEKLDKEELVYLIVPEQFTLGTEIEAFDMLDIQSTTKLKIKSFKSLVNEIIHYNKLRNISFISDTSKYLMMQSILFETQKQLKVFQNNINDKEFIDMLIDFIDELNVNYIDNLKLNEISENENISKELKDKLEDISYILNKYISLKSKSGYMDKEKIDIAIENIKNVNNMYNAHFYFYRFHDMSKKEIELLTNIENIAKSSSIVLNIDERLLNSKLNANYIKDRDVFDISYKFYKKVYNSVLENKIIKVKNETTNNINLLVENLFRFDSNNVKKEFENNKIDKVFIKKFKNTAEEVENLAVSIKKDIVENKMNYKDIAILVTNSEEYYSKIQKNFTINEIPFFIDQNTRLLDNGMIKYLMSLMYLLRYGLNTQNLIQFLKNSFLDLDYNDIALFENFLQRRNLRRNMIFDDKYYKLNEDSRYYEEDKANLEKIINLRNLVKEIFFIEGKYIFDLIGQENTYQNFVKKLYKLVSSERIINDYSIREKVLTEQQKEENTIIWKSFISLLDEVYLLESDKIYFERFIDILISTIKSFKIGIIPPSQDQIIIGDIKRSRFNEVKKLYIVGITNRYYPVVNENLDILSEDEKSELLNFDIELKNTIKNNDLNDLLSFYEILSNSKESIVFTYSLVNSSNEAMSKAYIMNIIENIIKPENIENENTALMDNIYVNTRLNSYIPLISRKIDNNEYIDKDNLVLYQNIIDIMNLNKTKYSNILNSISYIKKINEERKNIDFELVKKLYNLNKFSVTQLESFNTNAYNHFIRYGLKPRENESYKLSNIDTGNILHKFMQEFIDLKFNKNDEVDKKKIFEETVKNLLDEYKISDDKNQFFLNKMRDNSEIYSSKIEKQIENSKIENIDLEIKYGKDSKYKALEIEVDGDNINIEGKIDRVDKIPYEGKNYYRIIDYKTGAKIFDPSKIYNGIDLQLLLYLQSVVESDENGKPLGAFYQKLSDSFDLIESIDFEKYDKEGLFDELKMKGLINDDEELFKYLEEDIDPNKASDSKFYTFNGRKYKLKDKDNAFSTKLFEKLFIYNLENIKNSIRKIKQGNISLNPYKISNENSYDYSNYKTIDKEEGLKYRYLYKYNYDSLKEILESMKNEGEN